MYADIYEMVQPAVGSKRFGRKRFRVRKRPSNSPAKRELVNTKVERSGPHSLNQPRRSRSRQNASPSPLPSRKSRKGSQNPRRRVRSLSPHLSRKRRSIIRRIDEIQDSLRRLGEASGMKVTLNFFPPVCSLLLTFLEKIPEPDISPTPPPSGRSPGRSDSLLRYFSFPTQRSPSPYYSSPSPVPPTRSPTLAPPPGTATIPGLPPVPYWSLNLIKTPRPSRSPSADLRSHTHRSPSQDTRRSSRNILDERPPKGGGDSEDAVNIFDDQDVEILLPYGSPGLKFESADTDDLEGLTMDGMYLIVL